MNTQTSRRGRAAAAALWALAFVLLAGPAALAQSGRSTVRGTVRDQQGNVVTGAAVTLTDTGRNFTRTQTTNDEGGYTFPSIPPGLYRVEVEATGFKKSAVADVQALVDTPVDVDVQLEAGLSTETVTVTGSTEAPLNTTDATIGNAFESRRIEELPLNARNVVGLLSLQPGVTRGGYVNGGRADQANVTLDGVDNNEQQRGLDVVTDEAFASVLRSTPDSLQEFRVITSNANAEQGRSSGAQVSLVTKSGTNNFHGSLYHFHRNTVTTANDFFNNAAGNYGPDDVPVLLGQAEVGDPRAPRPQLLRNVFGGSIGGPIKKDRAFFFFTYEGFREASETPVVREVPLVTLGQGIVRYRTANGSSDPNCPAGTAAGVNCLTPAEINAAYTGIYGMSPGLNPAALAVLADAARRYPANDASVGDGLNTGGFRFNAKTPARLNTFITRMDFNLTDRQNLFLRGNYQQDNVTKGSFFATDCSDSVQCFPDTEPLTIWNHPYGIAVGHTWTASSTLVNRFTYGLTRTAFSDFGDRSLPGGNGNFTTFRFIYRPTGFRNTLFRTTPVHNIVEDVSWIKGTHNLQFGGNLRFIRNNRVAFANAFDEAVINPSWYDFSGAVLTRDSYGDNASLFPSVAVRSDLRDALAAVIGRYSQYSTNLTYDASGQLQTAGTPTDRTFATEEYELYWQDSWRMRPNLTLTYGLRWSTGTPVYETNGVQVRPTVSLNDYFARRVAGAEAGQPLNDPITLELAGSANDRPGYYEQDWNNFAPSVAVAWSPDFGDNFFGRLIGRNGRSVIRGGFRLTYDRIGSQLAANFDLNSALGFTSNLTIGANTFNVSDSLAPLFTGFGPNVRSFPVSPGTITPTLQFPLTLPSDEAQRIEQSLDDSLTTPRNYSFNLSYGRELGKGLSFEASYVGRLGRNLLASRDIMQLNNIRDPQSGMSWYEAINRLIDHRYAFTPVENIQSLPFFENLFPGVAEFVVGEPGLTSTQAVYVLLARPEVGGFDITDYTFIQTFLDDRPVSRLNNTFFHPQFAALSVYSTVARSNYHSGQFSLRHRFRNDVAFDLNYTVGHSLDSASGLQSATAYSTAGFILNALDPDSQYASSDFDVRHVVNANWLVSLPVGRGRWLGGDMNGFANTLLGDWQVSGIFRWNSGLPIQTPFQADRWATNWNLQSNMVRVCPVSASVTRQGTARVFTNQDEVFRCFREPRAGEGGDRNVLRGQGYMSLDLGLTKHFRMPWEGHSLQFRWEIFNVTNTQYFDNNSLQGLGLIPDPFLPDPETGNPINAPSDFGTYTATQTPLNEPRAGRVMQFALRYVF